MLCRALGLLGAEIDSLEVGHGEFAGTIALHGAEDELKIPERHTDLNAVGVAFAVVGGAREAYFWLLHSVNLVGLITHTEPFL